jgi:hypothetical protein
VRRHYPAGDYPYRPACPLFTSRTQAVSRGSISMLVSRRWNSLFCTYFLKRLFRHCTDPNDVLLGIEMTSGFPDNLLELEHSLHQSIHERAVCIRISAQRNLVHQLLFSYRFPLPSSKGFTILRVPPNIRLDCMSSLYRTAALTFIAAVTINASQYEMRFNL